MQDWPLLVHRVIDHAAIQHGTREVVTRSVEGPIHRLTYAALRRRLPPHVEPAYDGMRFQVDLPA